MVTQRQPRDSSARVAERTAAASDALRCLEFYDWKTEKQEHVIEEVYGVTIEMHRT